MVERIRELLAWQQLSPTQFADLIGIGRPVVSHILSERNKPSLEVVQRIIAAFPAVSLPWLLSGSGEMLVPDKQDNTPKVAAPRLSTPAAAPAIAPAASPPPAVPALPTARPAAPPRSAAAARVAGPPRFIAAPPASSPADALRPPPPAPEAVAAAEVVEETRFASLPAPVLPLPLAIDKKIRRIVIFYHDGSFADYSPED